MDTSQQDGVAPEYDNLSCFRDEVSRRADESSDLFIERLMFNMAQREDRITRIIVGFTGYTLTRESFIETDYSESLTRYRDAKLMLHRIDKHFSPLSWRSGFGSRWAQRQELEYNIIPALREEARSKRGIVTA